MVNNKFGHKECLTRTFDTNAVQFFFLIVVFKFCFLVTVIRTLRYNNYYQKEKRENID